jgi:hypothetical protein
MVLDGLARIAQAVVGIAQVAQDCAFAAAVADLTVNDQRLFNVSSEFKYFWTHQK